MIRKKVYTILLIIEASIIVIIAILGVTVFRVDRGIEFALPFIIFGGVNLLALFITLAALRAYSVRSVRSDEIVNEDRNNIKLFLPLMNGTPETIYLDLEDEKKNGRKDQSKENKTS